MRALVLALVLVLLGVGTAGATFSIVAYDPVTGEVGVAVQNGYEPLGGMPAYGGYAVGYHVVQAFLQRTGMSVEEATFVPADEIVAKSEFFAELDPA